MGGCPASVKSTAFSFFIGLSSPLDGEKKKKPECFGIRITSNIKLVTVRKKCKPGPLLVLVFAVSKGSNG